MADYYHLPHTESLAAQPRSCLQEPEEVPRDFTHLFDTKLLKFDGSLIPEAIRAFDVGPIHSFVHSYCISTYL